MQTAYHKHSVTMASDFRRCLDIPRCKITEHSETTELRKLLRSILHLFAPLQFFHCFRQPRASVRENSGQYTQFTNGGLRKFYLSVLSRFSPPISPLSRQRLHR